MKEIIERLIYWITRNKKERYCRYCCLTCEYYDWCKSDKGEEESQDGTT